MKHAHNLIIYIIVKLNCFYISDVLFAKYRIGRYLKNVFKKSSKNCIEIPKKNPIHNKFAVF